MAQRSSTRDRRSRTAKGRWRGRVVGLIAAAGAVLAFGMGPLANAPGAHADEFDVIVDPIINSLAGLVTGLDPSAGLDLGAAGVSSAEPLAALGLSADAVPAAGSLDALLHTFEQDWITSSMGTGVDTQLNTLWQDLGGTGILIGNGANGIGDGSLAEANGAAGGLWFGDGGNGATDAGGVGGVGGAAVLGDGGVGGNGLDGGAGGDGGDVAADRRWWGRR